MSRTKKLAFVCERKLLIVTLIAFFLSLFVAANVSAQQECEGTMEGTMCWKDYNDLELGGYMPDIDQNQDFANALVFDEHFSGGPGLPPSLSSYLWTGGGTCTVGGGLITVDACLAYNGPLYSPPHTLEFDATFTAYPFQHVGFGGAVPPPMFNTSPWIMFSTGNTGTQLYVRICPSGCSYNTGDDAIALGAGYLGSNHRYRIDWKTNGIDCYIDGILKVSRTYTINTPQMRVGISDYPLSGGNLKVDWISMDLQREYCAPVAEANSLWWLDKAHGLGIFELPYQGLGYIGHDINGDGVADVLDLVQDLAQLMDTNGQSSGIPHTGTTVADQQEGIETFLTAYNLHDELYEHTEYDGDYATCSEFFTYLEDEVKKCQDVKLDLGFYHVTEPPSWNPVKGVWIVTWQRKGGHAVTVAGVDSTNSLFAISDPDKDAAEAGAQGVVRPGPHGYPHDPILHNNEMYASHDIYTVGPSPSPGGKCGLLNYPWKWNFPENEWSSPIQTEMPGPPPPGQPPVEYCMTFTEIEAAVIVSPPICGDGRLDPGEECDDGNTVSGDGCSSTCIIEFCGDGILQQGLGEQCDDGNNVPGDGCDANCITEFCGDGILQPGLGEQCDDGNNVPGDGCNANCITEFCGDQIVQPQLGETCDPQGTPMPPSGNLCRQSCTYCGDGTMNNAEACDDGNGVNGDGCENNCTFTPRCGDGLINVPGETCDPPGTPMPPNGNLCRPQTCTYCGDHIQDPGEQCDDGNNNNNDGCTNNCTLAVCGDNIIGPGETCDPPGTPMPPNGNLCRPQTCTYCGDHIQDPGEQCDDGNNNNNDGCLNNCTLVPNVTCSFAPDGTTLIRGGTLRFWTTVQNNEGTTQTFKFATKVKLPNGNMYPLFLVGPKDVTLNSGQSASKQLSHTIPGTAPFGTYTYYGYVGNAPPAVEYGRCQFTFTVVQ